MCKGMWKSLLGNSCTLNAVGNLFLAANFSSSTAGNLADSPWRQLAGIWLIVFPSPQLVDLHHLTLSAVCCLSRTSPSSQTTTIFIIIIVNGSSSTAGYGPLLLFAVVGCCSFDLLNAHSSNREDEKRRRPRSNSYPRKEEELEEIVVKDKVEAKAIKAKVKANQSA
ncbi:hypothetical protein Scep_028431 [Stephania cephalantha]|uniref:Uncharacterized protein n=1 Tax=Stephania cephalantha TaxID=152367 RepID=A0AAP0EIC0_9MAGN